MLFSSLLSLPPLSLSPALCPVTEQGRSEGQVGTSLPSELLAKRLLAVDTRGTWCEQVAGTPGPGSFAWIGTCIWLCCLRWAYGKAGVGLLEACTLDIRLWVRTASSLPSFRAWRLPTRVVEPMAILTRPPLEALRWVTMGKFHESSPEIDPRTCFMELWSSSWESKEFPNI